MKVSRFNHFATVEHFRLDQGVPVAAYRTDARKTAPFLTAPVKLSGDVMVQVNGTEDDLDKDNRFWAMVERSTLDPAGLEGGNWVAVAINLGETSEAAYPGGPFFRQFREPAVAWWRVKVMQFSGFKPAIISISGGGA